MLSIIECHLMHSFLMTLFYLMPWLFAGVFFYLSPLIDAALFFKIGYLQIIQPHTI